MNSTSKDFFKELKELQEFQKEALNEAILELEIDADDPISSEELKKLIEKTETLIIQKEEHKKSAQSQL